jgi:hypothetical protein
MLRFFAALAAALVTFVSPHASAYETCTPENSYLEDLLPQPVATDLTGMPETCIETAHLTLATTGYYGFCETPAGQPQRDHIRPCVSEKYVNVVHTTLLDVADCLNYDPKLAFASFNLESAMHLNAVGRATDVGIGQLTKAAIDEVNLNGLAKAKRDARRSTKASCARILPGMTSAGSAIDERCAFMSLPENPVRNLVFAVLLLKSNRRVIDNLWNRYGIAVPPEVNSDRLKTMMAMLGYNAGPATAMSTLKAYIDQSTTPLTDHQFNFESTDADGFRTYLLNNFPSSDEAVRKRVSKYISYIINSARRVDGLAGSTGVCLHDYFTPTFRTSPLRAAPDRLESQRLVAMNLKRLADDYARSVKRGQSCAKARHDFEFAFLPSGTTIEQQPFEVQQAYKSLCK